MASTARMVSIAISVGSFAAREEEVLCCTLVAVVYVYWNTLGTETGWCHSLKSSQKGAEPIENFADEKHKQLGRGHCLRQFFVVEP
jgi:hypothetical protein